MHNTVRVREMKKNQRNELIRGERFGEGVARSAGGGGTFCGSTKLNSFESVSSKNEKSQSEQQRSHETERYDRVRTTSLKNYKCLKLI